MVPDVEMSVEDGFIEVSLVWEISLELVSWEDWVVSIELGDKLGELTLEVEVSMDEDVEDSGLGVVSGAEIDEEVGEELVEGEGLGGFVGRGWDVAGGVGLGDGDGLGEGEDGVGDGDGLGEGEDGVGDGDGDGVGDGDGLGLGDGEGDGDGLGDGLGLGESDGLGLGDGLGDGDGLGLGEGDGLGDGTDEVDVSTVSSTTFKASVVMDSAATVVPVISPNIWFTSVILVST